MADTSGNPPGQNPFAKDDPRNESWEAASRLTKEAQARFRATMLDRLPPERADSSEFLSWRLDLCVGEFDIQAAAAFGLLAGSYKGAEACEEAFSRLADAFLANAGKIRSRFIPAEHFMSELRIRIHERLEHFKAEAWKEARQAEIVKRAARPKHAATRTTKEMAEAELEAHAEPAASGHNGEKNHSADTTNIFRSEGDVWIVAFQGKSKRVRHSVGLGYIAQLLRSPRTEIEALALASRSSDQEIKQIVSGGLEVADREAIRQVQKALDERRAQLLVLEGAKNWALKTKVEEEVQKLKAYLANAQRPGGGNRKAGGSVERARTSVTKAIDRAIERIRAAHPNLADHLEKSIRKGAVLAYLPQELPDWEF